MPKAKKKSGITIKSNETKIVFGIAITILALAFILTPIMYLDSGISLFSTIATNFGFASIPWGITLLYFSLRFLVKNDFFKSTKILFGLILTSITINIFMTLAVPSEILYSTTDYSEYGGLIGFTIHDFLLINIGDALELVITIIILLFGLSLISLFKMEWIVTLFNGLFTAIAKLFNLTKEGIKKIKEKNAISKSQTNKDLTIHYGDTPINVANNDPKISDGTLVNKINNTTNQPEFTNKQELDKGPNYIENRKPENKPDNSSTTAEKEDMFGEPMYEDWQLPPLNLLKEPVYKPQNPEIHKRNATIIEKTLESFGVQSKVTNISIGPTVVQYALSITVGTKVAKVRNLANDLALALATNSSSVRIEAPIPGTSLIGIEIPNPTPNFVFESEMMTELLKSQTHYELPLIFGKSVSGQHIVKDLTDMPHLLVAGATGTGKSVGINSILIGMLMTKSPDELRLILVDPKMVEMSPYNGIPHLLTPVITDMEIVVNALQWATEEMVRRYRLLKQMGVRKIKEYNQKLGIKALPYIVIVIDEMADLMLTTGIDVESKIVRLTQMSRAVGIHLILATQRPSVDVITGLIKANVPGRVAFSVATAIDSRVIIDQTGAETLIGKGDMLFKSPEYPRPIRVQGSLTETKDIENIVDYVKDQTQEVKYFDEVTRPRQEESKSSSEDGEYSSDTMFNDALEVVVNAQKASASLLQRKLRIGYNRAARLMDELEEAGVVGPADGSNARRVLLTNTQQFRSNQQPSSDSSSISNTFIETEEYDREDLS